MAGIDKSIKMWAGLGVMPRAAVTLDRREVFAACMEHAMVCLLAAGALLVLGALAHLLPGWPPRRGLLLGIYATAGLAVAAGGGLTGVGLWHLFRLRVRG